MIRRRPAGTLRRRIAAATALISTVGMAVLVTLVVVVSDRSIDREISSNLSTRIAAARSASSVHDGRLRVADGNDALYDTLTWAYDLDGKRLAGPDAPRPLSLEVARLAYAHGNGTVSHWRLRSAGIAVRGKTVGSVVVAVDTVRYRSSFERIVVASIALGLAVILGATALSGAIVRRALAPVAAMTATADEWSQDRLEERFGLGPPRDEITGLGAVLDRLLERVDTAIRGEQRLTAELAHELRTPLTVIRGEADLGRAATDDPVARERFERIDAAAADMAGAMSTLLNAARGAWGVDARCRVGPVVRSLVERSTRDGVATRVAIRAAGPEVAVPAVLLERVLAPLLDNAARFAASAVTVSATTASGSVVIGVGNDGPVVTLAEEELFAPGVRGEDSPGAGLGLALSRRLARTAGGDVRLASVDPVRFEVELPAA